MARVLVVSDVDELEFFKEFERARNLWEFRFFRLASIAELSFFDCLIIYSKKIDVPLLKMIYNRALEKRKSLPILLIISDKQIDLLEELQPDDFFVFGNLPEELTCRITRTIDLGKVKKLSNVDETKNPSIPEDIMNIAMAYQNHSGYDLTINSKLVHFTGAEYQLIKILVENPGIPISRERMCAILNQDFKLNAKSRAVDVHIHNIKGKLGPKYANKIRNQYGAGFYWQP
ncbi:DNA-binding response regulator [Actinomycetota bacterium]|nr:DNA-binding response regulator [Actinomycetota bacterium]